MQRQVIAGSTGCERRSREQTEWWEMRLETQVGQATQDLVGHSRESDLHPKNVGSNWSVLRDEEHLEWIWVKSEGY